MAKAKKTIARKTESITVVDGIALRDGPAVYLAAIPGRWLLKHCTPSWRVDDPEHGFQRIVNESRAKQIASLVLDTNRTFPNAITLATNSKAFEVDAGKLSLHARAKFLVVDGQHRLWAQKYSEVEGIYPCILHMSRSEEEMAELFLEINDNQKKVPSSLRWDLYRLVRNDDRTIVATSDLVYELATRKDSPFYDIGIDLTGEKKTIKIKQGSLAPEIKTLISRHQKQNRGHIEFDGILELLIRFFAAVRSLDPEGWENNNGVFFKARVLRALIRVLTDLLMKAAKP
jgi:DGQHR domain-containing protein